MYVQLLASESVLDVQYAHTICYLFDSTFKKLVEINTMMVMAIKRRTYSALPVAAYRQLTADTYQNETSSVDTISKNSE